jgi:ubiquinone/menaquinone biosynthesis C-methylase UbiE
MSFYSRHIFPRLMDWAMSLPPVRELRPTALADAAEPVLEIGFGTGLNLPYYPDRVRRLTVLDTNPGMNRRAAKRIADSPIAVERIGLEPGNRLPVEDESFTTVVSTWTLCSIDQIDNAMAEVFRVLRPGGRLLFCEHGLSPDPKVARWQHRLTGLQKCIAAGCRLNRDIAAIVSAQPFEVERCDRFYMPGAPKISGYTYRGAARKPSR